MRDLAFVDVETTGLGPEARVIELAALRVKLKDVYDVGESNVVEWKIQPPADCVVEPEAAAINGYTPEAWASYRHFYVQATGIADYLRSAILVGWNVGFDAKMLEREFYSAGYEGVPWHYHKFDLMNFMMPLYFHGKVKSLSLRAACDHFGVSNEGAHGAKVDVLRTLEVFRFMDDTYHFTREG